VSDQSRSEGVIAEPDRVRARSSEWSRTCGALY
jgi:hypothetical protein